MAITSTTNSRNLTLDGLKGIGTILVVVGHSFFSFTSYIYLFHIALPLAVEFLYLKSKRSFCSPPN